MKILFAECCGDLVVPDPTPRKARWCRCKGACVWWDDPVSGRLAVYSRHGRFMLSIVGLHNGLLAQQFPVVRDPDTLDRERGVITGDVITRIIEETPASYLFKTLRSLVIRIRPGYTDDTRFAASAEAKANTPPGG
jgi:hypothetical protein